MHLFIYKSIVIVTSSLFLVNCSGFNINRTTIQVLGSRGENITYESRGNLAVSEAREIAQNYCDKSGTKALQNSELQPVNYSPSPHELGEYWSPKGIEYKKSSLLEWY